MRNLCATSAAILALVGASVGARAQEQGDYQVIVNRANPVDEIDRETLADVFLKKVTRWSDDTTAQPADLDGHAVSRERFSEEVLRRSIAAVKSRWQQIIFSGRGVPPPEFDGDAQVLAYVESHRGAVGYVSKGANTSGVKVLKVH